MEAGVKTMPKYIGLLQGLWRREVGQSSIPGETGGISDKKIGSCRRRNRTHADTGELCPEMLPWKDMPVGKP